MPAAVAIPAAVGLGSSVFSGIMGSRASNKAAQMQAQAAQEQAGKFQATLDQYNPKIQSAADQAKADVLAASSAAGQNLTGIASQAGQNLTDVAERGATGVTDAAGTANQYLQPYLDLGGTSAKTLGDLMAPGGDLNRSFTFADMQALDPGYQFRIDQANKALAGSAAARGGALGGGALKSAMNLSQNLASSEYGAAFDRFRTQGNDRYSRLSNLVDMGGRMSGQAGSNLMTAAQQAAALRTGAAQTAGGWNIGAGQTAGQWGIGANEYGGNALMNAAQTQAQNALGAQRSIADLMTGGAAAQAAGTMGSANAWSGALGGVANAAGQVGNYYNQRNLLRQFGYGNPSTGYGSYSPQGVQNPWNYGISTGL